MLKSYSSFCDIFIMYIIWNYFRDSFFFFQIHLPKPNPCCIVRSSHVNADKMEYMCFNQKGDFSTLNGSSLKLVDKFTYLDSSVLFTENYINKHLSKARTAIDRLSIIWKSDLSDKIKHNSFSAAVMSIILYGCTTWTLTKRLEKKLDGNCTRMLQTILNKSWKQPLTKL